MMMKKKKKFVPSRGEEGRREGKDLTLPDKVSGFPPNFSALIFRVLYSD